MAWNMLIAFCLYWCPSCFWLSGYYSGGSCGLHTCRFLLANDMLV